METRNTVPTLNEASLTLWRRPQCQAETGYPRSTFYARIAEGLWPRPIHIGLRSVAWPAREARAVLEARIAGAYEDAIRTLVARLEADRQKAGGR